MKSQAIYLGTVRVAANDYRVSVTAGPLFHEGKSCLSATTASPAEILIAGDTPVRSRRFALMCELVRAWTFETGEPRNADGWLALATTAAIAGAPVLSRLLKRRKRRPRPSVRRVAA